MPQPGLRSTKDQTSWLRRPGVAIALILVAAASLYFFTLERRSLWLDEGYSLYDARNLNNPGILLRPLFYHLLHFWMMAGTELVWLRGLSVLFALGGIYLTYRLGRRLLSPRVGLTAAALLVLSPGLIKQTQQIRMYSAGMFFDLAGSLALLRALDKPTALRLTVWILFRLCSLLTAPLNAAGLVADVLIILIHFRANPGILRRFALWLTGGLILWSPTAWRLAVGTPTFLSAWAKNIPPQQISNAIELVFLKNPISSVRFLTRFLPGREPWEINIFYISLIMGVCAAGIVLRKQKYPLLSLTLWTLLPPLVLTLFALPSPGMLVIRYFLFLLPYTILLLTIGFFEIAERHRLLAYLLALLYLIGTLFGMAHFFRGTSYFGQNWRSVVHFIDANRQENDAIIVAHQSGRRHSETIRFYLKKENHLSVYETGNWDDLKRLAEGLPSEVSGLWIVWRRTRTRPDSTPKAMIRAVEERFPETTFSRHHSLRLTQARKREKPQISAFQEIP